MFHGGFSNKFFEFVLIFWLYIFRYFFPLNHNSKNNTHISQTIDLDNNIGDKNGRVHEHNGRGSCRSAIPQVGRRDMQFEPDKESLEYEWFRFPDGFNGYWVACQRGQDQHQKGI